MSENFPTLTDLISRLEEHRENGIAAIEYRVDELLAVLRWNNTPHRHAQNRSDKSFQFFWSTSRFSDLRTVALSLFLKATRIHLNAEKVETWLANVDKNGSEP